MRPPPGTMNRQRGRVINDALATPIPSMACFITTEEALDAASDTSLGQHFYHYRVPRKRSLESISRYTPSQILSPTPTGASIASLSSSAFDLEMEPASPSHLPPTTAAMPAALSSVSVISSTSSPHLSPRRRGRPVTPSSDGHRREGAPQLIMPSLAVPQRRPFSESGRSIGKLKILLAGRPGIGKATLIQSIAQSCEHIVHLDSMSASSTGTMNEIYASTRPKPWWQAEIVLEGSSKRRRSSMSEILDRNLCFVIRSTFQHPSSTMAHEGEYVDQQLKYILNKSMEDVDLLNFMSGGGGPIVDAVLYMIPHTGLELADIECIKSLQAKTNVIPLLSRSDELEVEEISLSKQRIRQQIDDYHLDCFSFISPASSIETDSLDLFAVSSATKPDYDVMDASTLMSSDYIQPLIPTDLGKLVAHMFSAEGSAWLRHSAATKCVRWRSELGQAHTWALARRDPAKCALSPVLTANPFVQRQYWGRVEISNWAQGLRKSLEAEQFCHIMQQRVVAEQRHRGRARDLVRQQDKGKCKSKQNLPVPNLVHQDPLGLLHVASRARRNVHLVVELLSSVGIIGCFAAWMAGPDWLQHRGSRRLPMDVVGWCLL